MKMNKGMWLSGLKYMTMQMHGYTQPVTGYMMHPASMRMQMWMFHLMYMTRRWNIMLMANYQENQMGTNMHSEGFGDTRVMGSYTWFVQAHQNASISAGLSLPTGNINESGAMGMTANAPYAYTMQLGSGTFDPMIGAHYTYTNNVWTTQINAHAIFRVYNNTHNYRLGNQLELTLQELYQLTTHIAPSLSLQGLWTGRIHGMDAKLSPTMSPQDNPDNYGGRVINLNAGIRFSGSGPLQGQSLTLFVGMPIYQNLNGTQMKAQWQGRVMWSI